MLTPTPATPPYPPPPAVLKARFRSLLVGLYFRFNEETDMKEYTRFFKACCIVHNICLRFRDQPSDEEVFEAIEQERRARAAAKAQVHPAVEPSGSLDEGKERRRRLAQRIVGRDVLTS